MEGKPTQAQGERRLSVLLVTEGTYPFHFGGVSTWCHLLVCGLPEVDFHLFGVVSDPKKRPQFKLPPNVRQFTTVPVWGVRESLESDRGISLRGILARKKTLTDEVVERDFIPLFAAFLDRLLSDDGDSSAYLESLASSMPLQDLVLWSDTQFGRAVHALHRFFLTHDFDAAMRSRATWDCFVRRAQTWFRQSARHHGYPDADYSLLDLSRAMSWLYHVLFPISRSIPKADVVHAAMAGICTLVAACAKLEHGSSYLLTEHGIYLREAYLWEATTPGSLFLKLFRLRFARRITQLSYSLADLIAPCCDYNQRWEVRLGAPKERLKTVHYGVDSTSFTPGGKVPGQPPATVVWVGRINPLKDLETLLRAAAVVRDSRPDIQFKLYGSAVPVDREYHREMLALHEELKLAETVTFCGYSSSPNVAYNEADVVVLSSISEALPFCILEAMLCAKPVVATGVGGVPEQVAGVGLVVEPRNPEQMAQAILALMNDPGYCARLGRAARVKAAREFGIAQSSSVHLSVYRELARVCGSNATTPGGLFSPSGHSNGHANGRTNGNVKGPPSPQAEADLQPSPRERELDSVAVGKLASQVFWRDRRPIDALEVTALVESLGVTDLVARTRYGARDTFELGEAALDYIAARRAASYQGMLVRDTSQMGPPSDRNTVASGKTDWRALRMIG